MLPTGFQEFWQSVLQAASATFAELGIIFYSLNLLCFIPFALPLLCMVKARTAVGSFAVVVLALIGERLFVATGVGPHAWGFYALAVAAAVALGFEYLRMRRMLGAREKRLLSIAGEQRDLQVTLDRERFWRRATGDPRNHIPEEELIAMFEKLKINNYPLAKAQTPTPAAPADTSASASPA